MRRRIIRSLSRTPLVDLYATHADTIDSAIAHTCRVHRLTPDTAAEFGSWARLRLFDNEQAILRRFEGRSSLRTFLITVVQRLFLDWRNAEWGKWRPTAEARRLGAAAIELERLVLRDQHTYEEAVQTLEARGLAAPAQCDSLWAQLPRRPRRTRAGEDDIVALPSNSSASEFVDDEESRAEATAMCDALARALSMLTDGDRVLLQLRYWAGHSVARIAAITGQDQKGLYRRFDRLAAELRQRLEAEGLTGRGLDRLAGRFELDDAHDSEAAGPGIRRSRPSTLASTGGEHA